MNSPETARDMMVKLHGMLLAVERGQLEPTAARRYVGNIIHKMDGWEPMTLNDLMQSETRDSYTVRTPKGHLVEDIRRIEGWVFEATVNGEPRKQLGGMDILYVGKDEMEFDVID